MSAKLAPLPRTEIAVSALDPSTLEKLVAGGDMKGLTPDQRVVYYRHRCEIAGLDPATQPFEYIVFQGKLTLYARRVATDQLTARHRISVRILSRGIDQDTGLYMVCARAGFPDGREVDDMGAVALDKKTGDDLANAILKATTKAKRRAVLSACGLSMPDESEVDSIPGARRVQVAEDGTIEGYGPGVGPPAHANGSSHGRGQYASPAQADSYRAAIRAWIEKRNREWVDAWESVPGVGEHLSKVPELLTSFQVNGHIVKWAVNAGRLDPSILPEELRARQQDNYPAVVWHASDEDRRAVKLELIAYADQTAREKAEAIYRKHPALRPDGDEGGGGVVPDEFTDPPFEPETSGRQPGEEG